MTKVMQATVPPTEFRYLLIFMARMELRSSKKQIAEEDDVCNQEEDVTSAAHHKRRSIQRIDKIKDNSVDVFFNKLLDHLEQTAEHADFEVPDELFHDRELIQHLSSPYRQLKQNAYRGFLQNARAQVSPEDVPLCCCKRPEGCGRNCQNRLLFM